MLWVGSNAHRGSLTAGWAKEFLCVSRSIDTDCASQMSDILEHNRIASSRRNHPTKSEYF